jgi:hypothetical protein
LAPATRSHGAVRQPRFPWDDASKHASAVPPHAPSDETPIMNDGDLGDNITHHAEVAESQLPREYRFQNDDAHLEPRRAPTDPAP